MTGKQKCKILKKIRRQIAEQNDIRFVIEECTHKGNCRGMHIPPHQPHLHG